MKFNRLKKNNQVMKRYASITIVCSLTFLVHAQNNPNLDNFTKGLRIGFTNTVYNNTYQFSDPLTNNEISYEILQGTYDIGFGSVFMTKSKNMHQFELNNVTMNFNDTRKILMNDSLGQQTIIDGATTDKFSMSFSWEYIYNFRKDKDKKWIPSIGTGLIAYASAEATTPEVSTIFPSSKLFLSVRQFIDFRLSYFANEKTWIDFSVPLNFNEFNVYSTHEENPAVSLNQRRQTMIGFNVFPNIFMLKLGMGVKL